MVKYFVSFSCAVLNSRKFCCGRIPYWLLSGSTVPCKTSSITYCCILFGNDRFHSLCRLHPIMMGIQLLCSNASRLKTYKTQEKRSFLWHTMWTNISVVVCMPYRKRCLFQTKGSKRLHYSCNCHCLFSNIFLSLFIFIYIYIYISTTMHRKYSNIFVYEEIFWYMYKYVSKYMFKILYHLYNYLKNPSFPSGCKMWSMHGQRFQSILIE